jgi:BirA family biotin operon repressor/biotin-[acetyl-CoA-carboxylase] ligase
MIYHFDILPSTNDEAFSVSYREGDVVAARHQTAGRGQRGHTWLGGEGENLTFSLVLEPTFLPINCQFLISQAVALALVDTLREYGISPRIKWTNDIYVGDKKIVGILLEQKLQGGVIARTVAGIGINVNQREFDASLPNPTSMALECGREFPTAEVLDTLVGRLMERYEQLRRGEHEQLREEYHTLLYRLDEWHTYALADGSLIEGRIVGVEPSGRLIVEQRGGEKCSYAFREIEFMLKN